MDAFDEARVEVFKKVSAVRESRLTFKARVAAGEVSFGSLAGEGAADLVIATMKALPLIESLPGVGQVQTRRALEAAGISESIRIEAIEPNQWSALGELVYGDRL